jgi:hypothetical protein
MINPADIKEHVQVIGSCGKHIGTVDRVERRVIKLAKDDPTSGGEHHYIPLVWVKEAGQTIRLNKTCAEARAMWGEESRV